MSLVQLVELTSPSHGVSLLLTVVKIWETTNACWFPSPFPSPCLEPPEVAAGSQGWLLLETPDSAIASHPEQPSVTQRSDNVR
jgi:hypothetical protein